MFLIRHRRQINETPNSHQDQLQFAVNTHHKSKLLQMVVSCNFTFCQKGSTSIDLCRWVRSYPRVVWAPAGSVSEGGIARHTHPSPTNSCSLKISTTCRCGKLQTVQLFYQPELAHLLGSVLCRNRTAHRDPGFIRRTHIKTT